MLHDDDKDVMRLHILESERPRQVYHAPTPFPTNRPASSSGGRTTLQSKMQKLGIMRPG